MGTGFDLDKVVGDGEPFGEVAQTPKSRIVVKQKDKR